MAGVSYVVASRQDKGAIIILVLAGVGDLLEEDRHKADGVGRRAGPSFMRTNRVRDMILEVGARSVLAIPARLEHDLDANPVGTRTLGEFERLWDGGLVVAETMEVECVVVCGGTRCLFRRTSDHAETLRKLLDLLLGATMQVVDSPV